MRIHKNDLVYKQCIDPYKDTWQVCLYRGVEDEDGYIEAVFRDYDGEPSIEQIRKDAISEYDKFIDERVEFGYSFDDIPVQLNKENEDNYFKSFVFAALSEFGGMGMIKFPVEWKLGTKEKPVMKQFNNLQELTMFCMGAYTYKEETLKEGFIMKNNIDWGAYE